MDVVFTRRQSFMSITSFLSLLQLIFLSLIVPNFLTSRQAVHAAGASAVPGCTEVVTDGVTISWLPLSGGPGQLGAVHGCSFTRH